jgi:hypothetical protein
MYLLGFVSGVGLCICSPGRRTALLGSTSLSGCLLLLLTQPHTCHAGVVCKQALALPHVLPRVVSTPQYAHRDTGGHLQVCVAAAAAVEVVQGGVSRHNRVVL